MSYLTAASHTHLPWIQIAYNIGKLNKTLGGRTLTYGAVRQKAYNLGLIKAKQQATRRFKAWIWSRVLEGEHVIDLSMQIGKSEQYVKLCRRDWIEEMKLTKNDKAFLTPPEPPGRQPYQHHDWDELSKKYDGMTVSEISKDSGIAPGVIYSAYYKGWINPKVKKCGEIDWDKISEMGLTMTIRELSEATGLNDAHLRGEAKRGNLKNYVKCYKRG